MRSSIALLSITVFLGMASRGEAWQHRGHKATPAKPPHVSQPSRPQVRQPNPSRPNTHSNTNSNTNGQNALRELGIDPFGPVGPRSTSRSTSHRSAPHKQRLNNLSSVQVGATHTSSSQKSGKLANPENSPTNSSQTSTTTRPSVAGNALGSSTPAAIQEPVASVRTPSILGGTGSVAATTATALTPANNSIGPFPVSSTLPSSTSHLLANTPTSLGAGATSLPVATSLLAVSGHAGYRGHSSYSYGYRNALSGNTGNSAYFVRMRRLARLINDLDRLTPGGVVSTSHINRLRNDLLGVVHGGYRTSSPALQQLAMDLGSALPSRSIPMLNTGQLARDLELVMNGSRLNGVQLQLAINSARQVMQASGVNARGIQTVTTDLLAIASIGP